jgi:hypothetical protein
MLTLYPEKNIKMLIEWELLRGSLIKLYISEVQGVLYMLLITTNIDLPHIGYRVNKSIKELSKLSKDGALNLYNQLLDESIKGTELNLSYRRTD